MNICAHKWSSLSWHSSIAAAVGCHSLHGQQVVAAKHATKKKNTSVSSEKVETFSTSTDCPNVAIARPDYISDCILLTDLQQLGIF